VSSSTRGRSRPEPEWQCVTSPDWRAYSTTRQWHYLTVLYVPKHQVRRLESQDGIAAAGHHSSLEIAASTSLYSIIKLSMMALVVLLKMPHRNQSTTIYMNKLCLLPMLKHWCISVILTARLQHPVEYTFRVAIQQLSRLSFYNTRFKSSFTQPGCFGPEAPEGPLRATTETRVF